jgi:hypothetical protein
VQSTFPFFIKNRFEKYQRIPTKKKGNYFVFSMQNISGITQYLKKFAKRPDNFLLTKILSPKACSATVLWSGIDGFNVPVEPYSEGIGIVLDPSKIDVSQADLVAYKSRCRLANEISKSKSWDSFAGYSSKNRSNYPNKAGYYRKKDGLKMFTKNLARHKHIPGTKESIYLPQGNVECWAESIWYEFNKTHKNENKYIVNGLMKLNEGLAFQRGTNNPIQGLLITETPTKETAGALLNLMKANPSFELYFYDKYAKMHIVRYLNNAEAQSYLKGNLEFRAVFDKAQPFQGYSSQAKVNEHSEKVITGISFYLSNRKPGFFSLDFTRGKNRAEIYLEILNNPTIPQFFQELAIYSLLASYDGKTLQKTVAKHLGMTVNHALSYYKDRILNQGDQYQYKIDKIDKVVAELVKYANADKIKDSNKIKEIFGITSLKVSAKL